MLAARVVHQDAPHHLRRDAEEVRAVLPLDAPLADQLEVRLVDERRALQRVADRFSRQVPSRNRAQLLVDERHQLIERLLAAVLPGDQQPRDRFGRV